MKKLLLLSAFACVTLSYSVQAITVDEMRAYFYEREPKSNFLLFPRDGVMAEPSEQLCEITQALRENSPLDEDGTTPLDLAVKLYLTNWITELLKLEEEIYQRINNFKEIVQSSIKDSAELDLSSFGEQELAQVISQPLDIAGNTALHLAVAANKPDIVQALLNHGANPDKKNVALDLPMTLATRGLLKKEVFDILVSHIDPNATSALGNLYGHLLAYYRDDNAAYAMEKLVGKGMDVSTRAIYGDTPLHGAAWIRNIVMIEKLRTLGTNINDQNRYGQTAFHAASIVGCKATIDALLKFENINTTLVDQGGNKPSEVAANRWISTYLRGRDL